MIGRLIWFAVLFVSAIVSASLQLDRQSGSVPALAQGVPEPFRAFAQARITSQALTAGSPKTAVLEAERLLKRRPVPAQSLRMLAVAQARADQLDEAALSIQIAAQRGWRDTLAQESMARLAFAGNDEAEATRRYLALFLKQDVKTDLLQELGAPLFQDTDGVARNTMLDIVTDSERWRVVFLRRGPQVMSADSFAEIVTGLDARGIELNCAALDRAQKQIAKNEPAISERLDVIFQRQCGRK